MEQLLNQFLNEVKDFESNPPMGGLSQRLGSLLGQEYNGVTGEPPLIQETTTPGTTTPVILAEPMKAQAVTDPISFESTCWTSSNATPQERTPAVEVGSLRRVVDDPITQDDEIPVYADGFGELDVDSQGQLRYVGLGSMASVVDNCPGLRRHIHQGLKKKGHDVAEVYWATSSPEQIASESQEQFTGRSPRIGSAVDIELPSSNLINALFTAYVDNVLILFPIMSENEFRTLHRTLQSPQGWGLGHAAAFFSVLAVAAPLLSDVGALEERVTPQELGARFYDKAQEYLDLAFRTTGKEKQGKDLDIVISLGLLSMYAAQVGSQAEAWIRVGQAIRHAQDLGLHRSPVSLGLPVNTHTRRRNVWWCIYTLERQLCTALGRPLSIDDQDCDVELPLSSDHNNTGGFTSMILLQNIVGTILKTVNSVKNAGTWRVTSSAERRDELRRRVRKANEALQTWARDSVPQEIKTARSGTLLAVKQIALSSFFAVVMLLHRVFMSNPHRPSPLADSQAQLKSAKAATDCIRGTSEFFQSVPRGHYTVLHGQCVFVSAVVLLHCVRCSSDPKFHYTALKDVEKAMEALSQLERVWTGAKKSRAVVEEYMEFTFRVLGSDRKGSCYFDCHANSSQGSFKKRMATDKRGPVTADSPLSKKQRRYPASNDHQTSGNALVAEAGFQLGNTSTYLPVDLSSEPSTALVPAISGCAPERQDLGGPQSSQFDDTINKFLGAISPSLEIPDSWFGGSFQAAMSQTSDGPEITVSGGIQGADVAYP